MKKFVLIKLIILSSFVFAQEKSFYDYWNDTRIDSSILTTTITTPVCASSLIGMTACMEVLQLLHDIKNGDNQTDLELYKDKNSKPQSIKLKVIKKVSGNSLKAQKQRLTKYTSFLKSLNGTYSFPFIPKLEELLSEVKKDKKKFKYYVASAFNTFIEIAMDPHSRIIPRHYHEMQMNKVSKEYVGMGFQPIQVEEGLLIGNVFENSPAQKAGLRAGDLVKEIDNGCVEEEYAAPQSYLKGKKGQVKHFLVLRDSQEVRVDIEIDAIKLKYVSSKTLTISTDEKIGYIKLRTFNSSTICSQFRKHLKKIASSGANKLVLDLRDNPGGSVSETACIAGSLIGPDKVLTYLASGELLRQFNTTGNQLYSGELVVLVNGSSASAAELLPSALIDHKRAIIAGAQSFGKGNYQTGLDGQIAGFVSTKKTALGKWAEKWGRKLRERISKKEYESIRLMKTGGLYLSPLKKSVQLKGVPLHVEIKEVFQNGEERTYVRESDRYLFPLQPGSEQTISNKELEKGKLAKQCLDDNSDLILETIDKASDNLQVIDLQLAQTLHLFSCYQK